MISIRAMLVKKALGSKWMRNATEKMVLTQKRDGKYSEPLKFLRKRYAVERFYIDGNKCVTLKQSENSPRHILYFHGGGYTMEANIANWFLVYNVLLQTDAMLTFVNYPLAPQSTCLQTIDMVGNAYSHLLSYRGQEMILMGDSAGGGLALALAQHIKTQKQLVPPAKVVMLSPWLDISMSQHIPDELVNSDKMLNKQALVEAGKMYAGNLDTQNPLCSPLFGDLQGIGELALFVGESEILSVQARALKDKAAQSGANMFYREYYGMPHVFMAFPIPEAKEALREICAFINKSGSAE